MDNLRHGSHWLYDELTGKGDPFFLGSTHLSILLKKNHRYNYYTLCLVQRKFSFIFDVRILLI